MNQIDPDSLISCYESRISELHLPDLNDRHVLAAAIEGRASMIVTFNLSDFPESTLAQFKIKAIPPDIFLSELFEESTDPFLSALRKHRRSLIRPPKSIEEYILKLRQNRLEKLANLLEKNIADL